MPKSFAWPNDARICVVITVLVENWSDGKAPSYSPMTTPLKPGTYDLAGIHWQQYGGRAGAWRILKILDKYKLPATFACNARSLELYPQLSTQIVKSGHEIAGHGYTQDAALIYMTADEQRDTIRRCIKIIKDKTGARPVGWLSPVLATTDETEGLLAAEKFLWYGDYNNFDLPQRMKTKDGTFCAIPHSDYADNRTLRLMPRAWYDMHVDTFDYLYHNEPTAFLNVTVHANYGGRPLVSAMIDKFLNYMQGFPGVWAPRHDELARFVMKRGIDEWTYRERFFA